MGLKHHRNMVVGRARRPLAPLAMACSSPYHSTSFGTALVNSSTSGCTPSKMLKYAPVVQMAVQGLEDYPRFSPAAALAPDVRDCG